MHEHEKQLKNFSLNICYSYTLCQTLTLTEDVCKKQCKQIFMNIMKNQLYTNVAKDNRWL